MTAEQVDQPSIGQQPSPVQIQRDERQETSIGVIALMAAAFSAYQLWKAPVRIADAGGCVVHWSNKSLRWITITLKAISNRGTIKYSAKTCCGRFANTYVNKMDDGRLMLEVIGLSKSFGMRYALRDVHLRVSPGETVFLVGPNGAGKTTLLRIIASLSRPTKGIIRIGGQDLGKSSADVRRQIGYLSHRTLLYDDLTAEQNLQFYARMYGIPDANARISRLLEQVELTNRRYELVRTYSRGMQQRLAVARAVLHQPRLLLLDEPYSGLDTLAVDALTDLLTTLAGEGCSIILTTHQVESLTMRQRRAVVLNQGRIIYDGAFTESTSFLHLYRNLLTSESSSQGKPDSADPGIIEQVLADIQSLPETPAIYRPATSPVHTTGNTLQQIVCQTNYGTDCERYRCGAPYS